MPYLCSALLIIHSSSAAQIGLLRTISKLSTQNAHANLGNDKSFVSINSLPALVYYLPGCNIVPVDI